MCLWVVWREFKFLDEAAQKFLLENYFYNSLAGGIPVRERLKETLSDTIDLVDFMAKSSLFLKPSQKMRESDLVLNNGYAEENFPIFLKILRKKWEVTK